MRINPSRKTPPPKPSQSKFDAILGLGLGVSQEGRLPEAGKATVSKAVQLYKAALAPRIIFCGKWYHSLDYTPKHTEAKAMKLYAQQLGVAADKILTEEQSQTTIANFYYAKINLLLPNNWNKIVLVCSKPHANRARYLLCKVLGPKFQYKLITSDYDHPVDYLRGFLEREKLKLQKLIVDTQNIKDGDHKQMFKLTRAASPLN